MFCGTGMEPELEPEVLHKTQQLPNTGPDGVMLFEGMATRAGAPFTSLSTT